MPQLMDHPISRTSAARRLPSSLTWVYRRDNLRSGTLMRGVQLSEMARVRFSGTIDVNFVELSEAASLSNAVLILTTSIINSITPEEVATLRRNASVVCADFLDYPPRDDIHEFVDVYIASSIRQERHLLDRYPGKMVHRVTHHVDPEIGVIRPPSDACRIGYFGEYRNALHRENLGAAIDFVQTNNSEVTDRSWLRKLNRYNCHYAVREHSLPRRNPPPDSFKPFTKGFTAAHCLSNIIVPADESDALFYLGSDYPYLLKDNALHSVNSIISKAVETFGGTEWNRGLEMMEEVRQRSSTSHIMVELTRLIDRIARL
ncbi:hypothetical protein ABUE31_04825 [Mesorhizobium sp. ZMM04-5]|uniref:Glycosyltransferase family 1 protein n=1 Tax=Mesorhizobium marinum TaxID=3228790 RepID=A0ABV3QW54_9HYPH